MEDKVISEFKIVETEDGYRIEIKGDKERIKKMIDARHFGFGPRGFFGGHHRRHGHGGHGPFGFRGPWFGRGWGQGPWGWDEEEDDTPQHEGQRPEKA